MYPIPDQRANTLSYFRPNDQNLYPILDQNGSKAIPFGAAHTYMADVREFPPPPPCVCY